MKVSRANLVFVYVLQDKDSELAEEKVYGEAKQALNDLEKEACEED